MTIEKIALWRLKVPLTEPYNLSLGALDELDCIVTEITCDDGSVGIGDVTILPGQTPETIESAWTFCRKRLKGLIGLDTSTAAASLDAFRNRHSRAVTVFQVALDMIDGDELLAAPERETAVPILAPVNRREPEHIADEIEHLLGAGFGTLKVKVGRKPDEDLRRVAQIQRVNDGRARLRIDASEGYTPEEGIRFVRNLDADAVELLQQPCPGDDWAANMSVAALSPVPIMLNESIQAPDDIERAAKMPGCEYVKLEIARMAGVGPLARELRHIRSTGQQPVLGSGASTDIACWLEASVARHRIDNAGEMCGFLKNSVQLLKRPLTFENGRIVLKPGFEPRLDHEAVDRLAVATAGSG